METTAPFERPQNWSELFAFAKRAGEAFIGRTHQWVAGERMEDALLAAKQTNARDMEAADTTEDTIWLCERLLERHERVGICLQATLRRTREDVDRLIGAGARIRLVKGAYKEPPDIAHGSRSEIDTAYLKHLETLF